MSRLEIASPEEAAAYIKKLGLSDGHPVPSLNARLEGHVTAVCREAATGEEVWKLDQPNLITDFGLRKFARSWSGKHPFYYGWGLFLSPSQEPPLPGRYLLPDDSRQTFVTGSWYSGSGGTNFPHDSQNPNLTGMSRTYNATTLTWSYAATYGTSGARRIGTIGLACSVSSNSAPLYENCGVRGVFAYTVLNPVKTQTATQTVELLYRITLIPVY